MPGNWKGCNQSNHRGGNVRDCDNDDCEMTICNNCIGNNTNDQCPKCVYEAGGKK